MVISVGIVYYGIGYTGWLSTLRWNGISATRTTVGFDNFATLFRDEVFWGAIRHTVVFFVVTTVGQLGLGMLFAALLHSRVRWAGVYKVLIFIPSVLAPATMAPVFRKIFAPDGDLNSVLSSLGLQSLSRPWLAEPATALAVVMLMQIWLSVGVAFILYYAALGQIDPEMIEAARLDGAGNLIVFGRIVLPSVRGTSIALTTLSAIASLKTFDVPYLVTGGGPSYGTEFLGTLIYRISIPESNVGYGAAISIVLLVLAVASAFVFNRSARRRDGAENV